MCYLFTCKYNYFMIDINNFFITICLAVGDKSVCRCHSYILYTCGWCVTGILFNRIKKCSKSLVHFISVILNYEKSLINFIIYTVDFFQQYLFSKINFL